MEGGDQMGRGAKMGGSSPPRRVGEIGERPPCSPPHPLFPSPPAGEEVGYGPSGSGDDTFGQWGPHRGSRSVDLLEPGGPRDPSSGGGVRSLTDCPLLARVR